MDIPQDILKEIQVKQYNANDFIFTEGDKSDNFLYYVLDGNVNIYQKIHNKKEKINSLGKGQFFGEISLIVNTPRTAEVRSGITGVKIALIDNDIFSMIIKKEVNFVYKFLFETLKRFSVIEDKLIAMNKPIPIFLQEKQTLNLLLESRAQNANIINYVNKTREIYGYIDKILFVEGADMKYLNHIFFITEGSISLVKQIDDKEVEVFELNKGDLFGLETFIKGKRKWVYSAIVKSSTARIIFLDKTMLLKTAKLYPEIFSAVYHTILIYFLQAEKTYNQLLEEEEINSD
ncbi:MAG: cyclic nucleotide-binding domain-containing protein [Leptospirales bacterium]